MKEALKITETFQGNFNLDRVVQMIIPVHSFKKENRVNS